MRRKIERREKERESGSRSTPFIWNLNPQPLIYLTSHVWMKRGANEGWAQLFRIHSCVALCEEKGSVRGLRRAKCGGIVKESDRSDSGHAFRGRRSELVQQIVPRTVAEFGSRDSCHICLCIAWKRSEVGLICRWKDKV